MRYSVVPQVYTITAFGASISLWPFLSRVAIMPSMEGTPHYLIHPLFTLEFILLLSTAIVWLTAFLFSLYNMHKQKMTLAEAVKQNLFVVSLVLATVIVALSGCVGYSENVHFEEFRADGLFVLPGLRPPNLFAFFRAIHGLGIIICEPAWIITILSKYLPIPSKTLKHDIFGAY